MWASGEALPVEIVGGGSNIIVHDGGFDGLVVQPSIEGLSLGAGDRLSAGAGESWQAVVDCAVRAGLYGIECLAGIPGWAGATPMQNVGAYGQELAGVLVEVHALDRVEQRSVTLPHSACEFGYRDSRFKGRDRGRFVITGIELQLSRERRPTGYAELEALVAERGARSAKEIADAVLELRSRKGMTLRDVGDVGGNAGSFFLNPVLPAADAAFLREKASARGLVLPGVTLDDGRCKVPAAWLIEQSGFSKGTVSGRTGISPRHALSIVNRGGATAAEILAFAKRVVNGVENAWGVTLEMEPRLVGF